VFLSIEKEDGTAYNYEDLLHEGKLSIQGRKEIPVEVIKVDGKDGLSFSAGLPLEKSVVLYEDKDRLKGNGMTEATIRLENKKMNLEFYYEISALLHTGIMYGGSSVYIDSIAYNGRGVKPTNPFSLYKVKLKRNRIGDFDIDIEAY
jgi:hypothetical protein